MSIATEIQRLQTAKTSLATAIGNKGVTVPSSTKLDGYASLVDQIETGGGGGGLVYLGSFPTETVTFAETNFATWTPSTATKQMYAGKTVGSFVATDMANNEYFSRIRICVDVAYVDGTATAKGMFEKLVLESWNTITRRASTRANMINGVRNYNVAELVSSIWITSYYNTAWTLAFSYSYGVYPTSNTVPTLSGATTNSPTVTVYRPPISMRCHASYFSTAMAENVDQDASTITFAYDYYRVDSGYKRGTAYGTLIDIYNNGLQ